MQRLLWRDVQRWADDSKYEQRPVPVFAERREHAGAKYRNRMNSAIRQIAASLAGYAARRKFAIVEYDDTERSFCPGLPWFMLADRIRIKLDEVGIQFIASGSAATKTKEPLANEETE
jgi:hypothetical protein